MTRPRPRRPASISTIRRRAVPYPFLRQEGAYVIADVAVVLFSLRGKAGTYADDADDLFAVDQPVGVVRDAILGQIDAPGREARDST